MTRGRKKKEDSYNYAFTIKINKTQKDILDANNFFKKDVVTKVREYIDDFGQIKKE